LPEAAGAPAPAQIVPEAVAPTATSAQTEIFPESASTFEFSAFAQPAKKEFPAWTIWDVAVIPCATLVAIFVCSLIALGIAHSLRTFHGLSIYALAQEPLIVVGSQIASYPLIIGFMAVIVRRRSNEPFLTAIRWNWPSGKAIWFFSSGLALAFAVEGLARFLPIPKSLPMDKFFGDATTAYLMAFFGILIAPVLEELFFRGMLFPTLRRGLGTLIAVLLTAAAFASIHGAQLGYAWGPILSIFVVGLVLTMVRARTDSVAASVLTHSGYNFTLFALLWIGSDHFHHLEKLSS
jgi:membrane protease YdiL (CAAX protease family)